MGELAITYKEILKTEALEKVGEGLRLLDEKINEILPSAALSCDQQVSGQTLNEVAHISYLF